MSIIIPSFLAAVLVVSMVARFCVVAAAEKEEN